MIAIKKSNYNKIKIMFIQIFLFLLPKIFCNYINMKFNGTGKEEYFINQIEESKCPNKIIIDGRLIPYSTCKYKIPSKIITIEINLENKISNYYRMFSDISNIIEIDLSKLNTSNIKNMSYMFENCKSLIFANLSNIDISPEINLDYMFSNCTLLKQIDLTNVNNISKINNNKNIFFNCINLKKNKFIMNKRNLEQSIQRNCEESGSCNIHEFLNRTCQLNSETAYGVIYEAIRESAFELINNTIEVENEHFLIYFYDDMEIANKINLRKCDPILRSVYGLSNNAKLLIYIHELNQVGFRIPILSFSIFLIEIIIMTLKD